MKRKRIWAIIILILAMTIHNAITIDAEWWRDPVSSIILFVGSGLYFQLWDWDKIYKS